MRRISVVLCGNYLKGGHSSFPGQCRMNALRRGREAMPTVSGEAASILKKDSSDFEAQCPRFHQCLSTCIHSSFEEFFSNPHTQFNCTHSEKLGVQLALYTINQLQKETMSFDFQPPQPCAIEAKGPFQDTYRSLQGFFI